MPLFFNVLLVHSRNAIDIAETFGIQYPVVLRFNETQFASWEVIECDFSIKAGILWGFFCIVLGQTMDWLELWIGITEQMMSKLDLIEFISD